MMVVCVPAQACYWFSNGCSHGCEACDGVTRGPIPHDVHSSGGGNEKACDQMTPYPRDGPGGRATAPNNDSCIRKMDVVSWRYFPGWPRFPPR